MVHEIALVRQFMIIDIYYLYECLDNVIGAKFATLEIKSLLFHLIKNFEVIPNEKTDIPLELMKDRLFFTPKNGFHLSFKRRY